MRHYDSNTNLQAVLQPVREQALASATNPVAFQEEVQRISLLVQRLQESMERYAKSLLLQIQGQQQRRLSPDPHLHRLSRKLVDDILLLQRFLTDGQSILWRSASPMQKSIVQEAFPRKNVSSVLVCLVSDMYDALKNMDTASEVWQAPASFERSTTKYWVPDEDLTHLLVACAVEAPLLVYGKKGPLISPTDLALQGDILWTSLATRITSVYFDSPNMALYKTRIARLEGAQLLRARWYGDTMPTGDRVVFLELKTHHERWVAQKSVKERASILERDMPRFLDPAATWTEKDARDMISTSDAKPQETEGCGGFAHAHA